MVAGVQQGKRKRVVWRAGVGENELYFHADQFGEGRREGLADVVDEVGPCIGPWRGVGLVRGHGGTLCR